MNTLLHTVQIIAALGLLNVWVFRFNRKTPYRGALSENLPSEFAAYGLPRWSLWVVGALKLACASVFLAGIWLPKVVLPASVLLTALMIGAVLMHMKVRDPLVRSVPATLMMAMSIFLLLNSI
jgi:hypothetical protein